MKKTTVTIISILVVVVAGLAIKFSLREKPVPSDSSQSDNIQAKTGLENSSGNTGKPKGRPSPKDNAAMPKATQSDIQSDGSYVFGIVLDAPAVADLPKVESFLGQMKNIIMRETLNAGAENETNLYYVLDPSGKKIAVETYYIITARTDKKIADYFSQNSQSVNAVGGLELNVDLPEEKVHERLIQLMSEGRGEKFIILKAANPFPADWQGENKTP